MKVVVLSGGVGGARFVRGLVDVVEPRDVTVIGNVGDDVEVLGLHVSPDLDSILYALADLNDEERGWGRADETWRALEEAIPARGAAIAAARDGTTNALGLSDTTLFAPLYGPGSAERFRAHAEQAVDVVRAGLRDDVDTPADLATA